MRKGNSMLHDHVSEKLYPGERARVLKLHFISEELS